MFPAGYPPFMAGGDLMKPPPPPSYDFYKGSSFKTDQDQVPTAPPSILPVAPVEPVTEFRPPLPKGMSTEVCATESEFEPSRRHSMARGTLGTGGSRPSSGRGSPNRSPIRTQTQASLPGCAVTVTEDELRRISVSGLQQAGTSREKY